MPGQELFVLAGRSVRTELADAMLDAGNPVFVTPIGVAPHPPNLYRLTMLRVEKDIPADPRAVWQWVGDVGRWAELLPSVDEVVQVGGPSPIDVGSQFEVRQPGLAAATYTVTEWRSDAGFSWEAQMPGVRTVATHVIMPADGGSRLTLGIRWKGPLAGLVRLVFGKRTMKMITIEADAFARLAGEPRDQAGA